MANNFCQTSQQPAPPDRAQAGLAQGGHGGETLRRPQAVAAGQGGRERAADGHILQEANTLSHEAAGVLGERPGDAGLLGLATARR